MSEQENIKAAHAFFSAWNAGDLNKSDPGPRERREIWQKVFPPQTPVETTDKKEKLDWERLARFNLTGGNIHAIALNAAFIAAARGTPVTMSLVLQATRTEMRKLEKPINEADFRR